MSQTGLITINKLQWEIKIKVTKEALTLARYNVLYFYVHVFPNQLHYRFMKLFRTVSMNLLNVADVLIFLNTYNCSLRVLRLLPPLKLVAMI